MYPYQSTIARQLNVKERMVRYYLSELARAGLVAVSKAGRNPANYQLLASENCRSIAGRLPVEDGASLYDSKEASKIKRRMVGKETDERRRKVAQELRSYFGEVALNGKKADSSLVERLSGLVDLDDLPAFQKALAARIRARRADSWGIAVVIAQDFAARRKTG